MRSYSRQSFTGMNAAIGSAGILFGIIAGYIVGAGSVPPAAAPVQAANPHAQDHVHDHDHPPVTAVLTESELKAYKNVLETDPTNAKAAAELANRLYDAGRFAEAVPYYRQSLENDPTNVNVSTDLGTALYYAGRVDEALAQLERSLALNPAHGQTLFNIGVIRRDGLKDVPGAVAVWEKLLRVDPTYADAARVRMLIAHAKPQPTTGN